MLDIEEGHQDEDISEVPIDPLETETTSSAPPPSSRRPWFRSPDLVELVICFLFFVATVGLAVGLVPHVHDRPIPYQLLEESGEYVINLEKAKAFDGDTISGRLIFGRHKI